MQSPTEQISNITYVKQHTLASATQISKTNKQKNQTFKTSEERLQWMFLVVITVQFILTTH